MKSKLILDPNKVKEVGEKLINGEIIEMPEIKLCENDRIARLRKELEELKIENTNQTL